jgi:hypothetical protein
MPYYHYTSRQGAQDIICSGLIHPSSSGRVYLSTEVYGSGAQAANALGIVGKAIEIAFEIADNPSPPGLSLPYQATPVLGPGGEVIRRGGGPEVFSINPVTISTNESKCLALRQP